MPSGKMVSPKGISTSGYDAESRWEAGAEIRDWSSERRSCECPVGQEQPISARLVVPFIWFCFRLAWLRGSVSRAWPFGLVVLSAVAMHLSDKGPGRA